MHCFALIPIFLVSIIAEKRGITCGDPRWILDVNDPHWNSEIRIWTISDVIIQPYALKSNDKHINVLSTNTDTGQAIESLENRCRTRSLTEDNLDGNGIEPVFFHCPCGACPRKLAFDKHIETSHFSVDTKDAIIIFNSWGTTSRYHAIIDSAFPLWATVQTLKSRFNVSTKDLTLLNMSPLCDNEPHDKALEPIILALFGSYEYPRSDEIGAAVLPSNNSQQYNILVYGFLYGWRPYRNHKLHYNIRLGHFFRAFAADLKSKLLKESLNSQNSPVELNNIHNVSSVKISFIDRGPAKDFDVMKRVLARKDLMLNAFLKEDMQISFSLFGIGDLSTYQQQAAYSSRVSILIGAEGAGFIQQLFLPINSILVILHSPKEGHDGFGEISSNRWHEAVAQYLDHSVLNIRCSSFQTMGEDEMRRISAAVKYIHKLHHTLRESKQFAVCDVLDIMSWQAHSECSIIRKLPFLV